MFECRFSWISWSHVQSPCFRDFFYSVSQLSCSNAPLQHGCTMAAALLAALPSSTTTAATDLRPTATPIHPHRHVWRTHSCSPHTTSSPKPPLHSIAWHLTPGTHFLTHRQPSFPSSATTPTANHGSDHTDQHVFQAQPNSSNNTSHRSSPSTYSTRLLPPAPSHHPANAMVSPNRRSRFAHVRRVSMAPCVPWYS